MRTRTLMGYRSRDSVVGTDTRVAAGRRTIRNAISDKDKRFLFLEVMRTALGQTQQPIRSVLTLRLLMSYIYIYIYMEHLFLMFLDHTQRRSTVGRTPLDE